MKSILFVMAVIVMGTAQAKVASKFIERAISGTVYEVSPLCPPKVMCITNGTAVTFEFKLSSGCSGLKPLKYTIAKDKETGITTVEVDAKEQRLGTAVCASVIVEDYGTVALNSVYPPFQVQFVGSEELINIEDYY